MPDLLIRKLLESIHDSIQEIDSSLLKGLIVLVIGIFLLWFSGYFMVYGFFTGYWKRNLIILGIWLILEIAHWIGDQI